MTSWSREFILFINRYICCFFSRSNYFVKDLNSIISDIKIYNIIKKVRNYNYLENNEIILLKNLPKENLIEIIEIINLNTLRMNEIIEDLQPISIK
jgi:hypothetical protein